MAALSGIPEHFFPLSKLYMEDLCAFLKCTANFNLSNGRYLILQSRVKSIQCCVSWCQSFSLSNVLYFHVVKWFEFVVDKKHGVKYGV